MPPRQPLDQHLEEPGIVGRFQRIALMHEVDFKLPRPRLGNRGVGGNVHFFAGVIKRGEEGVESVERAQGEDFATGPSLARARRGRHTQLGAGIVDQEKLELGRHHRRQTGVGIAVHHRRQRLTRVARIGAPVHVEHPDRQQCGRRIKPRHRHEAALGRHQNTVNIAGFEHQRAVFDILTPDVEVHHRKREPGAVGKHLACKTGGDAFSPRHPVQVCRRYADRAHLGVLSQPVHVFT